MYTKCPFAHIKNPLNHSSLLEISRGEKQQQQQQEPPVLTEASGIFQ